MDATGKGLVPSDRLIAATTSTTVAKPLAPQHKMICFVRKFQMLEKTHWPTRVIRACRIAMKQSTEAETEGVKRERLLF